VIKKNYLFTSFSVIITLSHTGRSIELQFNRGIINSARFQLQNFKWRETSKRDGLDDDVVVRKGDGRDRTGEGL